MTYTNTQLKQTLAKMLPETVCMGDTELVFLYPSPYRHDGLSYRVIDTELLHLCWLVEEILNLEQQFYYAALLWNTLYKQSDSLPTSARATYLTTHATWQQRTIALAKVKGIEVV